MANEYAQTLTNKGIALYGIDGPPQRLHQAILADGPIMYWQMNEGSVTVGATLSDSSGNGINGTVTVGGFSQSASKPPGSDSFGMTISASNYATVASGTLDALIGVANQPYSIETWIRASTTGAGVRAVWEKTQSASANINVGYETSGSMSFDIGDTPTFVSASSAVPTITSQWNQFVCVRDVASNIIRNYINGGEVQTAVVAGSLDTSNTSNIILGQRWDTTGGAFAGDYAHFSVFNVALSPAQIATHHTAGITA